MRTITYIAFTLVFLVVLAGSVVRMTGSGMGCPDWPKCFGLLIPPTSEDQITWKQDAEYTEGQMVIVNDTLWQSTIDHVAVGSDLKDCECWKKYEKHDYAHFNARHTWIEYINRLLGALSGIPILLLFSLSIIKNEKFLASTQTEQIFGLVKETVAAVITNDERIDISEVSDAEFSEFLESEFCSFFACSCFIALLFSLRRSLILSLFVSLYYFFFS